tara:strand:- start:1057 stop:1341 length:285 start_codon:yes stop_codon:yes gene_type:complete
VVGVGNGHGLSGMAGENISVEIATVPCWIAATARGLMAELPPVPKMKSGSAVEQYVIACHQRIWDLIRVADPEISHTGDCLECADTVVRKLKDE